MFSKQMQGRQSVVICDAILYKGGLCLLGSFGNMDSAFNCNILEDVVLATIIDYWTKLNFSRAIALVNGSLFTEH